MKKAMQRKNYYLDTVKLKKAKKILHARTETETIHKALDMVSFQKEILESLDRVEGKGKGHFSPLR